MQALIPVFAILGVAAGAQLTLLPYAYLADPLPVYHQSQDTRLGVHAYSYAGGPSAKEEVRGLDGVTRGSYSYVDPYGVLQSVFYVADEDGFRVAATNLPTDGDLSLETSEVLLARNSLQELTRDAAAKMEKKEEGQTTSRRKRSLEASADQDRSKAENSNSQKDQADQITTDTSPKSSHELPAPEKKVIESRAIASPVYGLLDSVLIPRLAGAATSHQSRVDVHNNIRLKAVQPVETIGVLTEPEYDTAILPSQIPLATSHQSRVQVHNSLRVEAPEKLVKDAEAVEVQAQPAVVAAVNLEPVSLVSALPDYNENRIQLHKNLGLEGPNRKDTVKIDALPAVPVVKTPITALPAVPVITQKALIQIVNDKTLPFVIPIPSSNISQIQRNANLEVAVPIVSEPTVYVASSYAQPIATWPILAPVAQSSQYRSQIHSSEKIELAK